MAEDDHAAKCLDRRARGQFNRCVEGFDAWVAYLFDRPPNYDASSWDEPASEWEDRYARHDDPVAAA